MAARRAKTRSTKSRRVTLSAAVSRVKRGERVKVPGTNGRAAAWVISNADMRLLEELEDAIDVREAAEVRRTYKRSEARPLSDLRAELGL